MNADNFTIVQPNFVENAPEASSIESPFAYSSAWQRGNGYSPVEIIMAVSVLIGSIAGLVSVLVPVMARDNSAPAQPDRAFERLRSSGEEKETGNKSFAFNVNKSDCVIKLNLTDE